MEKFYRKIKVRPIRGIVHGFENYRRLRMMLKAADTMAVVLSHMAKNTDCVPWYIIEDKIYNFGLAATKYKIARHRSQ